MTTADFYEYVPPDDWKTLNALEGFSQNAMASTNALAGRSWALRLGDNRYSLRFCDERELIWAPADAVGDDPPRDSYTAREVLPQLFLIEFQRSVDPSEAVTILQDLERGTVTVVTSRVTRDGDAWSVLEEVDHGPFDDEPSSGNHERTDEMVGQRVQYIYGPGHAYEHIYLNESTYAWHCLAGAERGQADAEYSQAYKIRDRIYLFTWTERVVPCDGVVVIDWVNLRSNGRIFGWDTAEQRHNLIHMGARAVPLNATHYAPFGE